MRIKQINEPFSHKNIETFLFDTTIKLSVWF